MIKIRLARGGKRNDPFYRIVAIQKTKKRSGSPLDVVGQWYPKKNELKIQKDKIAQWVKKGAQLSDGVKKLMK